MRQRDPHGVFGELAGEMIGSGAACAAHVARCSMWLEVTDRDDADHLSLRLQMMGYSVAVAPSEAGWRVSVTLT